MKTFPISSILIPPNRQRREFDPARMHEFSDAIDKRGLLHPIVCRWGEPKPGEPTPLVLVAGERRLRAVGDLADLGTDIRHDGQLIPLGHIPYTLMTELDPLAYEEAELEENILRVDLTWQEKASAMERLRILRTAQANVEGREPPTAADLAREILPDATANLPNGELGMYQADVRKELIVAKHLNNPLVAAAPNLKEAFKILKREEERQRHKELGAKVGTTFTAAVHQIVNADSLTYLTTLPADSFDCIITDPPYGMGADEFGDSGGLAAGAHGYADSRDLAERCYIALATEGFRITKAQAHLYAFCDIDMFELVKSLLFAAGWDVFRTPLIWYKRHGSRAPWPDRGPQRKYELIVYATKGKRLTLKLTGDVLDFPADDNLGHAAQKPVALYQELLSRSCLPGNSVIDPFCGTGPVFPAAHALRIRATGIEQDQASYGISVERIADLGRDKEFDFGGA